MKPMSKINNEQVLLNFARKAFRRPVKPQEIVQYIDFFKAKRLSGCRQMRH